MVTDERPAADADLERLLDGEGVRPLDDPAASSAPSTRAIRRRSVTRPTRTRRLSPSERRPRHTVPDVRYPSHPRWTVPARPGYRAATGERGDGCASDQWPVLRQLRRRRPARPRRGRHVADTPTRCSRAPAPPTSVVKSVCPYCAVGCGQNVYVKDEKVVQIEGDPDSPISRGRLCPKGSASLQLTTGEAREKYVLYRRAARHRVGAARPRHRDGHDRRPGHQDPRRDAGSGSPRASASAARWASPASAARPWTTRRTTSSRSCSPRSGAIQIENQARI